MTFLQMPDCSYLNMDKVEYLTVQEYEKDFGRGPEKVFGVAAHFPGKTIFLCSFHKRIEAVTLMENIITELRGLEGGGGVKWHPAHANNGTLKGVWLVERQTRPLRWNETIVGDRKKILEYAPGIYGSKKEAQAEADRLNAEGR